MNAPILPLCAAAPVLARLTGRSARRPPGSGAIAAVLALGCAVALTGCTDDASRAPSDARPATRLDLLPLFDVALLRGRAEHVEPESGDALETVETPVRQRAPSALTYHVVLPQDARLEASGTLYGDRGAEARVRVRVAVSRAPAFYTYVGSPKGSGPGPGDESDGDSRVPERDLSDQRLAATPDGVPVALDVDLAAYGGQMARVRIELAETVDAHEEDSVQIEWSALGIGGTPLPPTPTWEGRGRYDVLVVVFDSLRADHTEPYGDATARTPNLARLAREGVTFENARSSASWTRPAVAAMLTSLEPDRTGVLSFEDRLPARVPYLPEILHAAGYYTLAVTNNANVSKQFGFDRGFARMAEIFRPRGIGTRTLAPEVRAAAVWNAFIGPAITDETKRPFFVYVHAIDPHSPYEAPEPYASQDDFGYDRELDTSIAGMSKLRNEPDQFDAQDIRELRRRYRAEIAYIDVYLGFLLTRLAEAGLERDTLVVVTADHGEEFRDHGGVGHGATVYEEMLRVPLILRLPGVLPAGVRVQAPANLVDLPATIVDLLGIEVPVPLEGLSLLPQIAGMAGPDAGTGAPRPAFGRAFFDTDSVLLGRFKLVRSPEQTAGFAPSREHPDRPGPKPAPLALYDLAADPGETRNVADAYPIVVGTLEQMLRWNRHVGARQAPANEPRVPLHQLDPSVRENLRALGYIE